MAKKKKKKLRISGSLILTRTLLLSILAWCLAIRTTNVAGPRWSLHSHSVSLSHPEWSDSGRPFFTATSSSTVRRSLSLSPNSALFFSLFFVISIFFPPFFSVQRRRDPTTPPPPFHTHTHTQNTLTVPTCRIHALIIIIKEKKERNKKILKGGGHLFPFFLYSPTIRYSGRAHSRNTEQTRCVSSPPLFLANQTLNKHKHTERNLFSFVKGDKGPIHHIYVLLMFLI